MDRNCFHLRFGSDGLEDGDEVKIVGGVGFHASTIARGDGGIQLTQARLVPMRKAECRCAPVVFWS